MENSVLSFIEGLLVAPDSGNPMNPEADVLFRTNREEFDKKVDVWKRKYAS
jgi:ubiquitin-protein ligase